MWRGAEVAAPLRRTLLLCCLRRTTYGLHLIVQIYIHAHALAVELTSSESDQVDRGVRGLGAGVRHTRFRRHSCAQLQLGPINERETEF